MYDFDRTLDHRTDGSLRWKQPAGRADVIGMGTADLDYFCPPAVQEAFRRIVEENTYNYRAKPDSYYQTVLGWYRRMYGLDLAPEMLSAVPGTILAVYLALRVVTCPGASVIAQSPYFGPVKSAAEAAGCTFIPNPMRFDGERFVLDLADFEEKVRTHRPMAFVLVNPHNPTGRVFTRQELESLVEICLRYDVKIVSDEVHSLVVYDGLHHIPALAVSEAARAISIQIVSASKGFNLMGLPQAIVAVAEPTLLARWKRALDNRDMDYGANPFATAALTACLDGSSDAWLRELTAYLDGNRRRIAAFFAERGIPITGPLPEASFVYWGNCSALGIPDAQIPSFFLEKAGVAVNGGTHYGPDGSGYVRMNFAVTRAHLDEALERIAAALGR